MERIQKNDKSIQETKKRIEFLLYNGDEKEKPKSEHAPPDVNSMQELKMEHIPKKTKKRDELVSESVITKKSSDS